MKESKKEVLEIFNKFYESDSIDEKRKLRTEILSKVKTDIENPKKFNVGKLEVSLLAHLDTFSTVKIKTPKTAFLKSLTDLYGF